jgi:hypothetical protein
MVKARARGRAPGEREIGALERARAPVVGELRAQRRVRLVGLGDDQQAARVLVEAVDDAGPAHAADAREAVAAMGDERVDQRAGPVAGGRMDDEARRLVDDDEVRVLEDDGERDVLALAGSGGQQGAVVSKPGPDTRVGLPAGAQVRQMVLEGNRIALYHDGTGGPGITVIDLATGQVLNRIVLTPEAPRP